MEDNIINKKVALAQIEKLGHAAEAVANGLEAIKALKQATFDVILMDCQMPELDGYETARAIRQQEDVLDRVRLWKVPIHIIALTANTMQGDREKCLAAGMKTTSPSHFGPRILKLF